MEKSGLNPTINAVVIGGSAGSLEVLFQLLPLLHENLSVAILIVLHRKNSADSSLAALLAGKCLLPVSEAGDKDPMQPGHIYLAPSDYHLLIEKDRTFSLDDSEKINYSRPSLDVTFESAADVYGSSLTGIVLSGANEDGTIGLRAIHNAGGTIIVQNPNTAQMPVMPQSALTSLPIDHVLNAREIAAYINLAGLA
jgi:two-component system chemotaxis response regulator CheB